MDKREHLHFLSSLTQVRILSSEWDSLKGYVYQKSETLTIVHIKKKVELPKKLPCGNFAYLVTLKTHQEKKS